MERRRCSEVGRNDSVGGSTNIVPVNWEVLPITQRGPFQRDDFFQAHRESFDAAVQRVLQRFGEDATSASASGSGTDTGATADSTIPLLRRYQRLKSTQPNKDDIQVVTQLQDDQHHKIVLDVREFMSGNLSVKAAGGEGGEVVVHGIVGDEATTSASASGEGEQKKRTFTHKFNLPSDVSAEDATPSVSSDGVLTIITPKKRKSLSGETRPQEQISDSQSKTKDEGSPLKDSEVTRTPEVRTRRRQRQPVTTNTSMEGYPIFRRGNFFEDSIFEDTHEDFNEAIQEILGGTGEVSTDDYLSYRRLRTQDLNEDNQAVTEIEDGKQHKLRMVDEPLDAICEGSPCEARRPIIIDVKDFITDGEVKVRALNEKDLVVEGRIEMDDNEKVSVKTFARRFSLPENAEVDAITSVISSDGVLAITTPKKSIAKKEIETIIPITIEVSDVQPTVKRQESLSRKESLKNKEPVGRNESSKMLEPKGRHELLKKSEPLKRAESLKSPEPLRKRTLVKRSESLKKTEFLKREDLEKSSNFIPKAESKEHIIPIQLEDDTEIPTDDEVDIPLEKESTSSKVDKDEDKKSDTNSNDIKKDIIVRRRNPCISPTLKNDNSTNKYLPIEQRGMFFSDSVFQDVQLQYKAAVGEVLTKYGFTSNKEDMSFYRLLRERSQNEDNQAACSFSDGSDNQYHKIVVDVTDFLEGDVNINIVSENELELEGQQDKAENKNTTTRNFKRRYIFPKSFNLGTLSCSLSEDGVIVIKAIKTSVDKSDNESEHSVKSILLTASNNSEKTDIPTIKETEIEIKKPVNEISESKEMKNLETEPKKDISVSKVSSAIKETSNDKDNSTKKDNSTNKDNSTSKDSTVCKDPSKNKDTSNSKNTLTKPDTPESKSAEEGTLLPISKKGSFFSDSFFEEAAQRNLQTAIRDVLNKTGLSPIDDDFKFYRNMREKSTNEQTQAVNSTENDKSYKIVIDVQGYDENNVKVIIVSDKEILVEGQQDIKDKSNTATRIFRRKFLLSNSIKTASVVSAVSSDGILTITAPKKVVGGNGMRGKKEVSSSVTINSKNPKNIEAVHEVSSESAKKL